jgi:hypothetical protein
MRAGGSPARGARAAMAWPSAAQAPSYSPAASRSRNRASAVSSRSFAGKVAGQPRREQFAVRGIPPAEQAGEHPVRLRVGGVQGQAGAQVFLGALGEAELPARERAIEVHRGLGRIDRDRLVEQFQRDRLFVQPRHHRGQGIEHDGRVARERQGAQHRRTRGFDAPAGELAAGEVGQRLDLLRPVAQHGSSRATAASWRPRRASTMDRRNRPGPEFGSRARNASKLACAASGFPCRKCSIPRCQSFSARLSIIRRV